MLFLFLQKVSSENVRFSRLLTHPSLLRAAKGDVDDIETSLLSQVVANQQLDILEEEERKLEGIEDEQMKVKRKEMKWETQQCEPNKETKPEEIHKQRQEEEQRKLEVDKIARSKEPMAVGVQDDISDSVILDITSTGKQQKKTVDKQTAAKTPTVIFKQLKEQYQSISEKLKEQEDRELARQATLESKKRDATVVRAARQSLKMAEPVEEEREDNSEIVVQLDQMGSYAVFNDDHHHDNATIATHKRHTQSINQSVGDNEYYQHMGNNNTTLIASKAT